MSHVLPSAKLSSSAGFASQLPDGELLASAKITTLQINLGLFCNLACKHCHVESSPKRIAEHENMSADTAQQLIAWLQSNPGIETIDLTGGSPEANPQFPRLVQAAAELGITVMDRCNPTILGYTAAEGQTFDWLAPFLAQHRVVVVASLPCYLEENVQKQRGLGSFNASIEGLRRLNKQGYGTDPNLKLHLVYNPNGPHLPPPEQGLADAYREHLSENYDIAFNELWTITNMPIRRWRDDLARHGQLDTYLQLLVDSFNAATLDGLMCRHQIHVDSQGNLYDCDFNYALAMRTPSFDARKLWEVTLPELESRPIAIADHCFGCTAGCGSSCGGAIV